MKLKKRKILAEKNVKLKKIKYTKIEFEHLSLKIQKLCPDLETHYKFINFLKKFSKKSEQKSDMIRDRKLRYLSYTKKTNYNRITVHNRTTLTITSDVLEILELGKNRGVVSDIPLSLFGENA